MNITENQTAVVVEETARTLVMNFETLAPQQKLEIKDSLVKTIVPILKALPESASPENLDNHQPIIREVAKQILTKELRNTAIFGDMGDEELASQIPEQILETSVYSLFKVTQVALGVLPENEELKELRAIADNFGAIDLDDELKKLLSE